MTGTLYNHAKLLRLKQTTTTESTAQWAPEVGAKFVKAAEKSNGNELSLCMLSPASGGARMQEALCSLVQNGKN